MTLENTLLALPASLIAGVLLGGVFVLLIRRLGAKGEIAFLALGLVVAAGLYVAFAGARDGMEKMPLEFAGLLLFGATAAAGARFWPPLIGIGWLAHGAWDILLHWPPPRYVPQLYPVFCVSFDLVVAVYVMFAHVRGSASAARR